MSDDSPRTSDDERLGNFSRRRLLKSGSLVAAGTVVGAGAFAGTASASQCPRTPGYWKTHEWPESWDNVNDRIDGIDFGSPEEGRAFLSEPKKGDKGKTMTFQLIATILNFQVVGSGGSNCYDITADAYDVVGDDELESVQEIKGYAQNWINQSDFPAPVRSWTVSTAPVSDGEVLKDALDAFNNNRLLECDCTGSDFDSVKGRGRRQG